MTFSIEFEATTAGEIHVALVVDEEAIWPHPGRGDGGSDFDPEDVVSYLADAWPSLLLAQSWPITFEPDQEPRSITGLLRAAEDRWEQLGASDLAVVESEGALLDTFLYEHDLSQMKHGSGLSHCFVLRQHTCVRIETNGEVYEAIPFGTFADQLNTLGSFAVELIRTRGDSVVAQVIERWEKREQIDPITAAAFISGLSRSDIERSDDLKATLVSAVADRKLSDIANDNNSVIYAAARSSGVLGPASLAEVLRRIQSISDGNITAIGNLRRRVKQDLRGIERPLDQGIRAANFVRGWLRLSDDEPVDLLALSKKLHISVDRQSIPDNRLDGIATFGPAHGPSILLNSNTRRHGATGEDLERSLQFTWSHEVGHLLLDRDEWPALVDAAKQRTSRSVETRANAFAAYLLLPPATAYRSWEQIGYPVDWSQLEFLLNQLTAKFGLPRIAASRQLARGAPPERRRPLEQIFKTHITNFEGFSPQIG
jgi:Zn-dependent peptidase ImmA (M78 family)